MSLLDAAIKFAVDVHAGQIDKAGKPYILHPLAVMLDPAMNTEEKEIVAVCHDTEEEGDVTAEDLHRLGLCDPLIYSIECLTHKKGEPLRLYYQRILSDPTGIAKAVKPADIRYNMECLPPRLTSTIE